MFSFSHLRRLCDSVSLVTKIKGPRQADGAFHRSVAWSRATTLVIMSRELNIKNYFAVSKELTLKAGEIFKCGFEGPKYEETKKNEWDLVTVYDRKIEDMLTSGLKAEFPDHEFIGEETSAETKEKSVLTDKPTWIIDPIDGTVNYVNSNPHTCISVALAICKELVVGIIYCPLSSELYTAIKGEGAFLNGEPIRTSCVTELKKALIEYELFSMRFMSKNRDVKVGRFEALLQATRGIRFMGSAAMAMAYLAKGALDCLQIDGLQPWDVAAGVLIIREAGGTVVDTKGDEYDVMNPNTIAAGNEKLALEIKRLIIETDLKVLRKRLTKS